MGQIVNVVERQSASTGHRSLRDQPGADRDGPRALPDRAGQRGRPPSTSWPAPVRPRRRGVRPHQRQHDHRRPREGLHARGIADIIRGLYTFYLDGGDSCPTTTPGRHRRPQRAAPGRLRSRRGRRRGAAEAAGRPGRAEEPSRRSRPPSRGRAGRRTHREPRVADRMDRCGSGGPPRSATACTGRRCSRAPATATTAPSATPATSSRTPRPASASSSRATRASTRRAARRPA